MKRLADTGRGLGRFYTPLRGLGDALTVVLWQLPPRMKADPGRLDAFLAAQPDLRQAVEFRDPAWYTREVFAVLRRHGAALCEHDLVAERAEPTARFRYLRFHGASARYQGRYGRRALAGVARELDDWGQDAYVYFNNDVGGHAVRDALDLRELSADVPAARSRAGRR
jgi:uncharacterized protein YecE (DUF72 family)